MASISGDTARGPLTPVETLEFTFQARGNLMDASDSDVLVPCGQEHKCIVPKKGAGELKTLCCHYARQHGLYQALERLSFHARDGNNILFNWSIDPYLSTHVENNAEQVAGFTIVVTQRGRRSEHVNFWVKAAEDLKVENTTIVPNGMLYTCLMLRTQRFSSLFRHYAKTHALDADTLEYYLPGNDNDTTNLVIEPLETPSTVKLGDHDSILVRQKASPPSRKRPLDENEEKPKA